MFVTFRDVICEVVIRSSDAPSFATSPAQRRVSASDQAAPGVPQGTADGKVLWQVQRVQASAQPLPPGAVPTEKGSQLRASAEAKRARQGAP